MVQNDDSNGQQMMPLRPIFDEKLVRRFAYDVDVVKYTDERSKKMLNKLVLHPIEVGNRLEFKSADDSIEPFYIPIEYITEISTPQQTEGFPEKKDLLVEIEFKDNQGNKKSIAFNVQDTHIEEILVKTLKPMEQNYWDMVDLQYNFKGMHKTTQFYYKVPFLSNDEELLWINTKTEGILNKHLTWLEALTNFRAIYYDFEKHDSGRIPLNFVDDVIVKNEGRTSMSNTFGNFVEAKNGSFGIEKSSTRHESPITIGDVLFVRDRRPVVTFVQISYPHEVAHLAKTVIKQLFTSVKKEKTLLPMVGEARRTSPVCSYCGSVNPMDLEFCNKCGFALR